MRILYAFNFQINARIVIEIVYSTLYLTDIPFPHTNLHYNKTEFNFYQDHSRREHYFMR